MRRCVNAIVFLLGLGSPALADCSMAQLVASAGSVIAPCTERLTNSNLTDAERSQALFVRGRGFHRTRDLERAAQDYRAAFVLDATNEEILVSWSNVDLRQRRMRDYVMRVEQAFRLNERNPRVLRSVGAMFSNRGDRKKAFEFYGRAIEIDPTEGFALYFRARLYRFERRLAEALADTDALVAIPRDVLNAQGFLDKDGTVRDFHVKALIERAYCHEDLGQLDLAEKDYDAAVEAGRSTSALAARAHFLAFVRDRKDDGLRDLIEAVKQEPDYSPAQYSLGLVLIKYQRFEEAFAAFDAAVNADPAYSGALTMRARMHRQLGRTDAAVRDLHDAIAQDPQEFRKLMSTLRYAGYWTAPGVPNEITPQLTDAMRACMIDIRCN